MSRAGRLLGQLARAAATSLTSSATAASQASAYTVPQVQKLAAASTAARSLHTSLGTFAANLSTLDAEIEHATGLERQELEKAAKGVDPWHEDWLDAPFGTPENPVVVPSIEASRIVGVPDPYDDSIIWWDLIEDGQPPKQIVDGGEYFVLKHEPEEGGHH
ncbi:hypothetical protein WJX72_004673 [[Myrmecia] bisecta]|uniref:Uncharacterized protein n=1 Tax=[Myrmecia] bisecta TaxID=41462 RepID=A0AAW1QQH1_9CHLO